MKEQERTEELDDVSPSLWHRRAVDHYKAGEYGAAMAASSIATVTMQRLMWQWSQEQVQAGLDALTAATPAVSQ